MNIALAVSDHIVTDELGSYILSGALTLHTHRGGGAHQVPPARVLPCGVFTPSNLRTVPGAGHRAVCCAASLLRLLQEAAEMVLSGEETLRTRHVSIMDSTIYTS